MIFLVETSIMFHSVNYESLPDNQAICGQCSSSSGCASWQSDQRATLSADILKRIYFTDKLVVALRSDCLAGKADLELHCLHMENDKCCLWQDKM